MSFTNLSNTPFPTHPFPRTRTFHRTYPSQYPDPYKVLVDVAGTKSSPYAADRDDKWQRSGAWQPVCIVQSSTAVHCCADTCRWCYIVWIRPFLDEGASEVSYAWPRKRWPILEVAERVERQLTGQIKVGRTYIGAYQQELLYSSQVDCSSVETIFGLPANNSFGPLAKGLRRLLLLGGPLAGPSAPWAPRNRGACATGRLCTSESTHKRSWWQVTTYQRWANGGWQSINFLLQVQVAPAY